MNLREIRKKLELKRRQQNKLRKKIDVLRKILSNAGENPDAPKVDLIPRIKKIYRAWKRGKSFSDVGKEFSLSSTTIAAICHRIEIVLEIQSRNFQVYKDLLKYK